MKQLNAPACALPLAISASDAAALSKCWDGFALMGQRLLSALFSCRHTLNQERSQVYVVPLGKVTWFEHGAAIPKEMYW